MTNNKDNESTSALNESREAHKLKMREIFGNSLGIDVEWLKSLERDGFTYEKYLATKR